MSVKLLTEQYLELLSLKEAVQACTEATLVTMPHCWKSHVTAHFVFQRPDKCHFHSGDLR